MKIFFLLNPSNPKRLWDYREAAGQAARRSGGVARFGQVDRSRPPMTEPLLHQAMEEGCERVVVVGGDGTLNRAVNALHQMHRLATVSLGVVPAGTCNDFARTLGFSRKRVDEAMRIACTAPARECDLGQMDKMLFLNNAGFGRRKPLLPVRRMRPFRTLRSFQPTPVIARWDKGTLEGQFFMGLACNAPYFSGGLYFSRNARLHDNLLDIYLVPRMPKWKLVPKLLLGRFGRPVTSRQMITLRVGRIEFESEGDLWPQADGEPAPVKAARRVVFGVAPEKVMIVVPQTARAAAFWD
jgi:YegS/Rv2252/BmrU family lipid kinase